MSARTAALVMLLWAGFQVCPVQGQSFEGSMTTPLRTAAAREAARLAEALVAERAIVAGGPAVASQVPEDVSDWNSLRSVKAGTRLVVSRVAARDLKVRMEEVTADTLRVRGSDVDVMNLRRDEVMAVYQDHRFTTKEWLGIGVLAGAATGLAIGAIADSRCGDCELGGLGIRVGPIVGAVDGLFGGLFLGGIANRNPPRLIFRASSTARGLVSLSRAEWPKP